MAVTGATGAKRLGQLFLVGLVARADASAVAARGHPAATARCVPERWPSGGLVARTPTRLRAACTALGEYTVRLPKPLGIVFEEVEVGKPAGVRVARVVEGSNADLNGRVCVGDELVSTSAVVFTDKFNSGSFSNWERQMVTCTKMEFDGIMAAIRSNDGRYGSSSGPRRARCRARWARRAQRAPPRTCGGTRSTACGAGRRPCPSGRPETPSEPLGARPRGCVSVLPASGCGIFQ